MYAHDTSSDAKHLETYKPYLHVFDAEGKEPITKGPGGTFPHHRGIFIGWNQITFNGKKYDRWHMKGGDIVHQKFTDQKADADQATFTSLTHWIAEEGKPLIEEERTMTFRRAPAPARLIIDFSSKLECAQRRHQPRRRPRTRGRPLSPGADISSKETVYVFPTQNPDAHKDLDFPWVGESYTLHDHRYSVVEMNAPTNPKQTHYSAYRDYGRFGAFFKAQIKNGEALTVKYRFLIADGEMPPSDVIQKSWDQFAAVTTPTQVPVMTVKNAEGTKAK